MRENASSRCHLKGFYCSVVAVLPSKVKRPVCFSVWFLLWGVFLREAVCSTQQFGGFIANLSTAGSLNFAKQTVLFFLL